MILPYPACHARSISRQGAEKPMKNSLPSHQPSTRRGFSAHAHAAFFQKFNRIFRNQGNKKPGFLTGNRAWKNDSGQEFGGPSFKNPALGNENTVIGLDGDTPVPDGEVVIRHGFSPARHLNVAGAEVRNVPRAYNGFQ